MPDPIGYQFDPIAPERKPKPDPIGYPIDPLPPERRTPATSPTGYPVPPTQPLGGVNATQPYPAPAASPTPAAPPAPASAPAPAPGDPNAALGQVQTAFQQKFNRAMTPEEQQALVKYVGYTGGQVSPDMLQKALGAVGQYTGNLQNPGLGAPGAAAPVNVTTPQLEQQQRNSLMDLLNGKTPVTMDPNDPAIQAQRNSFDRTNAMVTGRQRLAAAERNAARGTLGAGGYDANLMGAENDAATRKSAFEGDLLQNERQGQIDRLMSALGMTQQYGATQLQGQLGRGQLGLGLLNALLNDKQAGNLLGFNYTSLQNQMNNQAMQNILNNL